MKGLSVLLTIVLLVLAQRLAQHLKRAGALPAQNPPQSSQAGWPPSAVRTGQVDAPNQSWTI